jgi:hypothetical protein
MNEDLTILYYTANRINEHFAANVRQNIIEASNNARIISISHKPINFGENVCVGSLEPSAYNIYKQVLIGAMLAKTPYIGCAEDDSLYTKEHFAYRPPLTAFGYNTNRWQVSSNVYFFRRRASMCMCIAPTEILVQTLCQRFAKFPRLLTREEMGAVGGFGEPGRFEARHGLTPQPLVTFDTEIPSLTFNHRDSTGGVRRLMPSDVLCETLAPWGEVGSLWKTIHG